MSARVIRELLVLINGVSVGWVMEDENGALDFSYEPSYDGIPLSLSMPVANVTYGDKVVRPFLFGLLPEDRGLRRRLGDEFGVSGNNPFALLGHIGSDCAGAVQVLTRERPVDTRETISRYHKTSTDDIASRLRAIRLDTSALWQLRTEHWSLGGQQSKIALAQFDDAWFECEGSAATTHIIKPGIPSLACQALNEHLCLRLASLCGLPASESSYVLFNDEPAIVVKRYDRLVLGSSEVMRLHQEDLCQALSVFPDKKYPSDGGPSVRDVVLLLDKHPNARENKAAFVAQLFFNYLVGAPDAHAKNFSVLLHDPSGPILSPLYDVASGLPYDYDRRHHVLRCAMSIGGENRIRMLRRHHVQRLAEVVGFDDGRIVDLLLNLAEAILHSLSVLEEEARSFKDGKDLADRLIPELRELNEQTIHAMERSFVPSCP